MRDEVLPFDVNEAIAVCGTYGIPSNNSIKFFTLPSVSRGIPWEEWDIFLEDTAAQISTFTFYPQANILAVADVAGRM